ncbi:MAG: hypothetical protein COV45_05665 [Deltaproteobacteria bacterium CG11_big_fil_rev_8_21_14_0_20_47_16]|nr:MAG: hypothetical protein COV45_05665 [Deltaproteobacteria bacterium CG11_big_fil_rev_8_21_14_0_20_47_16]
MTESNRIGIDIGGTHIRLGVVRNGQVVQRHQEPVGRHRHPSDIASRLQHISEELLNTDKPDHVGIGLPGIIDINAQRVLRSPHFPEWVDVPFGQILQEAFTCPMVIDNDANMALRGEATLGAAKDLNHAIMITLGTGIGGAIMLDRKIVHGNHGFAGEMGHMVIDRNGPKCACGSRGCWELYASAQAFQQPPHTVTDSKEWHQFGYHLGLGIASLANVLGITDVIVGGGLSNAWEKFEPSMKNAIPQFTYPETAAQIRVQRAYLKEDAALIGASL